MYKTHDKLIDLTVKDAGTFSAPGGAANLMGFDKLAVCKSKLN